MTFVRGRHERDTERGVALLLVLWTFAVLAALAGEFAIAMRREAQSAANFKQESLARYTAIAGLNEAILSIQAFNGKLTDDDDEEEEGVGVGSDQRDEEGPGKRLIRTLLEGRGDWVTGHLYGAPYSDYEVRAIDETGKLSLNAPEVDEPLLREILLNLDYDEVVASVVADSIVDWRDEDDLHRAQGAEDDYYRKLERPYPCKDAPFDAVEELRLVRGVTRAMYYGHDGVPGLRDIFTTAHDRGTLTPRTASDKVEWALCGDPERRGVKQAGLDDRTDKEQAFDVLSCMKETGLTPPRNQRRSAQLGYATIEARVKDPNSGDRIVAHVGAQVQFKGGGGFQTVRWYDSIFEE
jgi:hypothetical protein